ncbi:MAG TPA: hypothetical protein PLK61_03995, partial [Nitrosomonas sp.]|nr:hypothetical protein [Nitrosomonas sp.]
QYGENLFLTGFFMAQNRENGRILKASKAYLPRDLVDELVAGFNSRTSADDVIKFTVSITAVESPGSAAGYTFICEPARTPEAVNRESEMLQVFLALPAPDAKKKKVV